MVTFFLLFYVQDIVIHENEKPVKEFTSSSDIGNCIMSKLVEELYVDPLTGMFLLTHQDGFDVCVRRCDVGLSWFKGGTEHTVEERMKGVFCNLRISLFDISILNDKHLKQREI